MELTKICRTCLSTNFETRDVYNIRMVNSVNFVQVLLECTSVQITRNDILPQKICVICIEYVKNYYKFRQKCIESQTKLFHYINNLDKSGSLVARKSLEQNETLHNVQIKTENECAINNSNLKVDQLEESSKSDTENTNKNNNKYPEFVNIQECNYGSKKTDKNKLIEKIDDSQLLNEPIWFSTVDVKTEIKYESEDENVDNNNKNNSTTEDDDTFSEDEFFKTEEFKKTDLTCISCNEQFLSENNLRKHIREVHDKGYRYLCHICSKLVKSSSNLTYHLLSHQPESERKFVCAKCNRRFVSSTLYKRHMTTVHIETKKFSCHICPARFKQKLGCIKHINSIHSDKLYSCKFCQKKFNRVDNLKQHVKIHTGERPHVCDVCGKDFLYIHVLRSHLKTHEINK